LYVPNLLSCGEQGKEYFKGKKRKGRWVDPSLKHKKNWMRKRKRKSSQLLNPAQKIKEFGRKREEDQEGGGGMGKTRGLKNNTH